MLKVSVIVPVYNAKAYLEKCMRSILIQTLSEIEIICIDDGSTDGSNIIVKQFAMQDNRVHLIEQQNQGVSVARNRGIERAQGEYISFVDADDWVEPDFLEILYKNAKNANVLISICGYVVEGEDKWVNCVGTREGRNLSQKKALEYTLRQDKYQGFLWNKLFHNSLFKEKKIRLDESLLMLEDLLCVCQCILCVPEVYYQPEKKYHYNRHAGSTFQVTEKSQSMYLAAQKLIQMFANSPYQLIKDLTKSWHCYSAGVLYLYYEKQKDKYKAKFYYQEQKRYLKEYFWIYKMQPKKLGRGFLIAFFPRIVVQIKKRVEKNKNVKEFNK